MLIDCESKFVGADGASSRVALSISIIDVYSLFGAEDSLAYDIELGLV